MLAMSLMIQDFRAGTFVRGRGVGHSAAQAHHTSYSFRCNFCPIVAVAFLGLSRLAPHTGPLANERLASACRSLGKSFLPNYSCSTIHKRYSRVGTMMVVCCTS